MVDVFADDLARYEAALGLVEGIREEWTRLGMPLLSEGYSGQPVPHPLVKMLLDAESAAARAGDALKKKHRGPAPSAVVQAKIGSSPAAKLRVAKSA